MALWYVIIFGLIVAALAVCFKPDDKEKGG